MKRKTFEEQRTAHLAQLRAKYAEPGAAKAKSDYAKKRLANHGEQVRALARERNNRLRARWKNLRMRTNAAQIERLAELGLSIIRTRELVAPTYIFKYRNRREVERWPLSEPQT